MSQYTMFYIKKGDSVFTVASYSRSSYICDIVNEWLPFENVRPISRNMLHDWRNTAKAERQKRESWIRDAENDIALIATFNNSTEEKCQAIFDKKANIEELKEDVDAYNYAENFFEFLDGIADEAEMHARYTMHMSDKDAEEYANATVYAGIESNEKNVLNYKDDE